LILGKKTEDLWVSQYGLVIKPIVGFMLTARASKAVPNTFGLF